MKFADAVRYEHLTYSKPRQASRQWTPPLVFAWTKMPIIVLIAKPDNIPLALRGEKVGTLAEKA